MLARVEPRGPACHTGSVSCFGDAALAADALGVLDATIAHRVAPLSTRNVGLLGTGGYPTFGIPGGTPPEAVTQLPREPALRPAPARVPLPEPPTAAGSTRPSYTHRLLADRNLRLKKMGEETAEFVLACADGNADRAVQESVDLIYHLLVNLHSLGATLDDVRRVVAMRRQGDK